MSESLLLRFLEELDRAAEFARQHDSIGVDRYAALRMAETLMSNSDGSKDGVRHSLSYIRAALKEPT